MHHQTGLSRRAFSPLAGVLLLVVTLGSSPWPSTSVRRPGAAEAAGGLGPAPAVCNPFALVEPCYYQTSFVDFNVSSHFVHVGQTLTASMHYVLPARNPSTDNLPIASVAFDDFGQGLELERCTGKKHVVNRVGHVTEGDTSCTFKAVRATGWSVDLGAFFSITGSNTYKIGDFYAVTGRTAIEGTIRVENNRGAVPTDLGVAGSSAIIRGPQDRIAATNTDGYFYALVDKGGKYTVKPRIPDDYTEGVPDPVTPKEVVLNLPLGGVAEANFKVKDSLRLRMEMTSSSVPATGAAWHGNTVGPQRVTVTVTATRQGSPAAYFPIRIRLWHGKPYKWENIPVPATVCTTSRVYPSIGGVGTTPTPDFNATTDANGKVTFTVDVGTIPGSIVFDALPLGANSEPQLNAPKRMHPEKAIRVTPMAGDAADIESIVKHLQTMVKVQGWQPGGQDYIQQIAFASAKGLLGAVNVSWINGNNIGALLYPAGYRYRLDAAGNIVNTGVGEVLEPAMWFSDGPGFETALRFGGVERLPTLAQWTRGGIISWDSGKRGWNMGEQQAVPYSARTYSPILYLGWPYPAPGVC